MRFLATPLTLGDGREEDMLYWNEESSGEYSVQSVYWLLQFVANI